MKQFDDNEESRAYGNPGIELYPLSTTEGVPSARIEVTTQNGTVILSGLVDTKEQVENAVAAAKSVRGVHEVNATSLKAEK